MIARYFTHLTAFIGLLALSTLVLAQGLSDREIKNFISSMEELQTMEEEFAAMEEELAAEDMGADDIDFSRMMSSSISRMEGTEAYSRLEDVVEDHGFDGAEEWAQVGDRVFQAMMAIEMSDQAPEMQAQMRQSMEQIENNPNMTAEQKEQMRQMMGAAMSSMETASDAPPEDVNALRPHMEELRRVFEMDAPAE